MSNVTPIWVACGYGSATGTVLAGNNFIRSADAEMDFPAVRMGWIEREDCLAREIEFRSNKITGLDFNIEASPQHHSYSVYWTLTVNVTNKQGKEVMGADISIVDSKGEEVFSGRSDASGSLEAELPEYGVDGDELTFLSPYTVSTGRKKEEVILNGNQVILIKVK
jgi:hypothetical protein